MNKDLVAILEYLEREKGIKRDIIVSAIEESLRVAARKSVQGLMNLSIKINQKTGDIEVIGQKEVVEKVTIPEEEISLQEARKLHPYCELGQWINITTIPQDFGRIAAQVARQVIAQKLKEAERDVIYEEYRHRVKEVISGSVKRVIKGATLIVDLGKVEGILPERFYPKTETYNIGDRVQALLLEVKDTEGGGAEVVLSRNHPEFVLQLFAQEVPEIQDGTIKIEKIARDPGYRTKMAVSSTDPKVDPIGACVGTRGNRIKNVIQELNNEKIDVVLFAENTFQFLQKILAPVQAKKIEFDETSGKVTVLVDDEQYPIVLGKKGMNARLIGQLLEADLNIQKMSDYQNAMNMERHLLANAEDPSLDEPLQIEGVSHMIIETLISAGFDTPRKVLSAKRDDLAACEGISLEMADKILEQIRKTRM
ncbi:MAG: transcription termination factor NusA [Rhabdochlamydiaceae bacterium]